MKKLLIIILLLFLSTVTIAQTGMLMPRYYISGSLSIGQEVRGFADSSSWLQIGNDTTNKGVLLPKVLLDSIQTAQRALFVYDLEDSVLYHFDGTDRVRYMTYKDTTLIKQLIFANAPDLAPFVQKTDTARDKYIATYWYIDSSISDVIRFPDTLSTITTRTYNDNNYFKKNGNSFGTSVGLGLKDNYSLDLLTANIPRLRVFNNGHIGIGTTTDNGYQVNVEGSLWALQNLGLSGALYFDNTSKGIEIASSAPAGQSINIGRYNTGFETSSIKIGYYLEGRPDKNYILNLGFFNDASTANNYNIVTGSYNNILGADMYTQVYGSYNTVNYTPNSIAEGASIIGSANLMQHKYCTIIGFGQATTANNQLIFAQARGNGGDCGYNDVYFGTGPRSGQFTKEGSNVTINGSGAGDDVDKKGGYLRLAAGKSTGAAAPPDLVFATATTTSTGSGLQSLVNRWYIKGNTGKLSNNINPTGLLDVDGMAGYDQLRLRTSYTPGSSADPNGSVGDVAWDENYIYIKTSAGWKRSSLSAF